MKIQIQLETDSITAMHAALAAEALIKNFRSSGAMQRLWTELARQLREGAGQTSKEALLAVPNKL